MKKEYGFPFRGGWVKAKKKPIDGFPKKKERTFQLEQNYRLNLLYFLKENLQQPIIWGFGCVFFWVSSLEEPLTLVVIKVIFQALTSRKSSEFARIIYESFHTHTGTNVNFFCPNIQFELNKKITLQYHASVTEKRSLSI